MGKGWGYGKQNELLSYNKFKIKFENESIKVYEASIIYMGYLTIKIIHNKTNKDKNIILKYENKLGKNYKYNNITLKNAISIIKDKLLDDYWYLCN